MGTKPFDQYSLLHFASGVVAYFVKVPLWAWFIFNILFELFENSVFGISLVSQVSFWPGGKHKADTSVNSICDILCCMLGWGLAYYIDYLGERYGWYNSEKSVNSE